MEIASINIKPGKPDYWNVAWYVRIGGIELKFKQKAAPKKADILEVYKRVSVNVEPVIDRGLILAELKSTIMDMDIKPLELFEKNLIGEAVK